VLADFHVIWVRILFMKDIPTYRRDFRTLAELRAEEARVLLRSRRQLGAYYLAGYAVECALKACIAKQRKRFEFPPKKRNVEKMYSHDLDTLLDVAGLEPQLKKEIAANPDFAANWNTVRDWTSESRYETSGLNGKELYNAVTGPNGVLPWIRLRW
jgi:hypothetical protein